MKRSIRKQERGQAMAELAVCAMMFVALLTFGIHFGEVGYMTAKVHEAAAHAMWDSTAYKTFDLSVAGTFNSAPTAAFVQGHTNFLYHNYEGLTSETGYGSPVLVNVQAAGPMTVTCQRDATMGYGTMLPGGPGLGQPGVSEPNGISCSAQGIISPMGFAAGSMKLGPGFSPLPTTTSLCGVGKATGGSCANNHMSILLGDFGLAMGSNNTENTECPLQPSSPTPCGNSHFYNLVANMWSTSPSIGYTGVPENWADNVDVPSWFGLNIPGGKITGFYMSFRGERTVGGTTAADFSETIGNGGDGSTWQTSPMDVPPPGWPTAAYRQAYSTNPGSRAATVTWPSTPTARKVCEGAFGYCYLGKFPCN